MNDFKQLKTFSHQGNGDEHSQGSNSTTVEWLSSGIRLITNDGINVGKGNLIYFWWECKLEQMFWKSTLKHLKNVTRATI